MGRWIEIPGKDPRLNPKTPGPDSSDLSLAWALNLLFSLFPGDPMLPVRFSFYEVSLEPFALSRFPAGPWIATPELRLPPLPAILIQKTVRTGTCQVLLSVACSLSTLQRPSCPASVPSREAQTGCLSPEKAMLLKVENQASVFSRSFTFFSLGPCS